jgi:hypothetical protein
MYFVTAFCSETLIRWNHVVRFRSAFLLDLQSAILRVGLYIIQLVPGITDNKSLGLVVSKRVGRVFHS